MVCVVHARSSALIILQMYCTNILRVGKPRKKIFVSGPGVGKITLTISIREPGTGKSTLLIFRW